jgi:hypothetical protein
MMLILFLICGILNLLTFCALLGCEINTIKGKIQNNEKIGAVDYLLITFFVFNIIFWVLALFFRR